MVKKSSIKLTEELIKRLHNYKHEFKVSSVEKTIINFIDRFEDFKKLKKLNLNDDKLSDEEKLKMLKEEATKIIEEVERLENKKSNQVLFTFL